MTQLSIALAEGVQSFVLSIATVIAILVYGHASTVKTVHAAACYVAVTTIVSQPNPYRIARVVTSGVRRYDDDGAGTPSYCEPRDVARFDAARAAVERLVHEHQDVGTHLEHAVIRSTSPAIVSEHLKYIVAGAQGLPGVEVVSGKGAGGVDDEEIPLPPLLKTDSARSACAEANVELKRSAASFHWAC